LDGGAGITAQPIDPQRPTWQTLPDTQTNIGGKPFFKINLSHTYPEVLAFKQPAKTKAPN